MRSARFTNLMMQPPGMTANTMMFGQMYTVGLEWIFYFMAPFLLRRSATFIVVLTTFAGLYHYALARAGWSPRPWQYEFFPGIFYFFMLGAVSYRFYAKIKHMSFPPWIAFIAWGIAAVACWAVQPVSVGEFTNHPKTVAFYLTMTLLIPVLFKLTKDWRLDSWLGELSFPIFAVHYLIASYFGSIPGSQDVETNLKILAATVASSVAIASIVGKPVERLRAKIARSRQIS